jgi:O-antigen/teichoic acid export membrane protein
MTPERLSVGRGCWQTFGMRQRAVLVLCGALVAAAWGVFGVVLVTDERDPVKLGLLVVYFCLAATLTWWAVELLVREWRGRVGRFRAARVSAVATLATLWLALTGATLPYWAQAVGGLVIVLVPLLGLVLTARALVRRRRKNTPPPRSRRKRGRDERLAERALEARTAKKAYRG